MQNIHCSDFGRLLESAVESRRPADLQLREHAATCEHCRAAWERYLILEDVLRLWTEATPDVDLAEPVLAKLAYDAEHPGEDNRRVRTSVVAAQRVAIVEEPVSLVSRPRDRWRWSIAAMLLSGTAAALLALAFLSPPAGRQPGDAVAHNHSVSDGSHALAAINSPPDQANLVAGVTRPRTSEETELTSAVRDAGVAYLGLANGAAEAVTQGAALLSPTATNPASMTVDDGIQPTWVDRVRTEVTPLSERLEGALDFLIDAFPTEPTPTT